MMMLNNPGRRIYHCCSITPTKIIVILLLLSVPDDCFANVSGRRQQQQQTNGGILSRLLRHSDRGANNNHNDNNGNTVGTYGGGINPVTIGIQRALSRRSNSVGTSRRYEQVHAKLQSSGSINTVATPDACVASSSSSPSNNSNDEEYDESPATRFAFIDYSKESTDEIRLTMKPHLKLTMMSEETAVPVLRLMTRSIPSKKYSTPRVRGGEALSVARPLLFWESMISGAVSRSIAQTTMHPANTMKTMMQSNLGPNKLTLKDLVKPRMFRRLSVGAGANFVLSLPQ